VHAQEIYVAMCCSVLQCCVVLQGVASAYNCVLFGTLREFAPEICVAMCYSVLQYVAVCCIMLQRFTSAFRLVRLESMH